ncbi:MAG: porin family protein [Gammaproteobacteria bacterium]|nr:porin family protein [Gammaproteobacteria bacterium]
MKRTAIAAIFFLIACVANADNESAGWRIGGALAYADFERSDGSIDDTSVGFKMFAQYRFNSWLGAEGAYYNSSDFSDDLTPQATGGEAKTSYKGFSINGIGYIPLPGDRIDLFLKAGYVDFTNVKLQVDGVDVNTRTEDGLTLGFGASVLATDVIGIRAEFDWYDTNAADLWSFNLGAEYRF